MTAVASVQAAEPAYTDMTLEELLDARSDVLTFLNENRPKIAAAAKAQIDLETMIALRMEETGSRKFERGGFRGAFKMVKRGSASVHEADALRAQLSKIEDIPAKALDEALPYVTPPPFVKPDLRKVRKLCDYGNAGAKIIIAHINEPLEYETLVIEAIPPEMIDVTPEVPA